MRKGLTESVCRLYNQGATQEALAKQFNVSQATIHYIVRGRKRMAKKERTVSWRAKLTPHQVRRLRRMHATGKHTTAALAEKFEVSQATVSNIINGKVYRKVA